MTHPRRQPDPQRRHWLASTLAASGLALVPTWPAWAASHVGAKPALSWRPVAGIEPVSETFFGQTVVDPYRWMENAKDKDWEPFMRGQDAHTRAVLGGIPGRDALKARIAALSGGVAVAYGAQKSGNQLFYQVRPAGGDNFKLAVRAAAGGPEQILIDPATMKGDGGVHVSLDGWQPSPDGKHVVYGLSPAGSENSVLHVMEVDSMSVLPERIAGTQYAGPSWLPDGSGFFYGRVNDLKQMGTVDYYKRAQALLHRLGTDPKEDLLLAQHGRDSALPIDDTEFPAVVASGSCAAATTVVPEGPKVVESIAMACNGLYVLDLDRCHHSLRRLGRDGSLASAPLGFEGSVPGLRPVGQHRGRRRLCRRHRLAAAAHDFPPRPGHGPHRHGRDRAGGRPRPQRLRGLAHQRPGPGRHPGALVHRRQEGPQARWPQPGAAGTGWDLLRGSRAGRGNVA